MKDAETLRDALRAPYAGVAFWDRSEEAWQAIYQCSHEPVLLLESTRMTLELEGLAPLPGDPDHNAVREIRIYPAGVIVFRYVLSAAPDADVAALFELRKQFDEARRPEYHRYLRRCLESGRLSTSKSATPDGGISMVPSAEELQRHREGPAVERRDRLFYAHYARWALCVGARPIPEDLSHDLEVLAEKKRLDSRADDLDGLIKNPDHAALRLRAWPGVALASWEGFDVYVAAGDEATREDAIDSFELAHQFAFLCRAWIDILDQLQPEILGGEIAEKDIATVERRLVELSRLEGAISTSMIEIDSAEMMLLDPRRLEFANDYSVRFKLRALKAMVFERLDAVGRQTGVARDVLSRKYAESVDEQSGQLQIVFLGAIAAQIAALVPAVAAVDESRTSIAVVAALLTAVIWIVFALIAWKLFGIRLKLRRPQRPRVDGAGTASTASETNVVSSSSK